MGRKQQIPKYAAQAKKNKMQWARFPPSRRPGRAGQQGQRIHTASPLEGSRTGTHKSEPGKESSLPLKASNCYTPHPKLMFHSPSYLSEG